jgi:CheY-like chemotaxis protein
MLISDIGMQDEDGYSLIRRIRALPANRGGNVPAVALTAYVRSEDRAKALDAGFQIHMGKPVEPAELVSVIERLVGKTRE